MKKIAILIIVFSGVTMAAIAQDQNLSKKMGFGFQLGQYQRDFNLGVNITSPYFMNERLAIRVKANYLWNEHPDTNAEMTWTPYSNVSVGVLSMAKEIGGFLRLYGEGGVLFLFPSAEFSSENVNVGGYGLFGFEFFMDPHTNYFIEIGGSGSGAVADKIPGKPIYSNGLLINVGFRFQF